MMGHKVAGDWPGAISADTSPFSFIADLLGVNWSGNKNTATTMTDH
jgi:hypothetical protein